MKRTFVALIVVLVLLFTTGADNRNFAVPLSGGQEVPPRDTKARGLATFQLNKDGTELEYTLIVANIENVVAAHIHCGAAGVTAPVGVTLLHPADTPESGRFDGILAEGTITAPDPGNACGWTTLDAVIAAMMSGNAYVNVHTNDGVAPPNTGPGDFPGGEIRGQIK